MNTRLGTVPYPSEKGWTPVAFRLFAILICLVTVGFFFRQFFLSGFNQIAGDVGDNRFIIAILEHWRAVAHGAAHFTSPNFFWPEPGVLGYSESMFLLFFPFAAVRSLGSDSYVAFELALIAFKIIGFFSMLWLLRSVLRASRSVSIVGAALFTISNLYFISIGHAQLATVVFTPLIAALACSAWREYGSGSVRKAYGYGVSCAALTALTAFTCFYIGWFTILAAAGCLLMAALIAILDERSFSPLQKWLQEAFARRRLLTIAALVFIVAMVPFLVTYLPALKHTGGRSFGENLVYSARPVDLVNVGHGNWMWSSLLQPALNAPGADPVPATERTAGWPPVILLLTVTGGLLSLIRLFRNNRTGTAPRRTRWLILIFSASFLCLWALTVRVGRWSLWWLVYKLVPGGSAIRVPVRFNFALNVLLVLSACLVLEQLRQRRRLPRFVFVGIVALLFLEQINLTPTHAINRPVEDHILAEVQRPPAACSSFLVTAPFQPGRTFFADQTDAMLIARAVNLPTVNGYSGWFPPDWNLLNLDNNYLHHVRRWTLAKHLDHGLCGLDLRDGSWSTTVDLNAAYSPNEVLDFRSGGNSSHFEGEGWGEPEPDGTWTIGGRSVLVLPLAAPPSGDMLLTFEAHAFTPPQRSRFDETILVNGSPVAQLAVTAAEPLIRRQMLLPAALLASRVVRIEFVNHDPESPAELGVSGDSRKVGLALRTLRLEETTYTPGQVLDFHSGGNAQRFEGQGWGAPEPGGSWTVGAHSVLLLPLAAPPPGDLLLSLDADAFTPPQRSRFQDTLMVNGRVAAQWSLTATEPVLHKQVRLSAKSLQAREIRIEFINHDPRSPADLKLSADTRQVGLALHTLRLDPTTYSIGEVLDFHSGGNAQLFEGEGWGAPEPGGSWTVGAHSVLILPLAAPPPGDLLLSLEAHAFTPPQRTHFDDTLMVNGKPLAQWPVSSQEPYISKKVRLPAELLHSKVVRIEFVNHDPRSPADFHLSSDTRQVGLALHTLRLDQTNPIPTQTSLKQ